MLKRFLEWIKVKKNVHFNDSKLPFFSEGEMWWAYIGDNVGSEINGKGEKFTRPVIVYRKLGSKTFLAIPVSTKQKEGTWYVPFKHKGIDETALLAQVRVISTKRLNGRMGELDNKDFFKIREKFITLYK